jgi:hypothetical protein
MATHRIAHLGVQSLKVIRLGEDIRAHGAGDKAPLGGFFDDEVDLGHGDGSSYTMRNSVTPAGRAVSSTLTS